MGDTDASAAHPIDSPYGEGSASGSLGPATPAGAQRSGLRDLTSIIIERGFASEDQVLAAQPAAHSARVSVDQMLVSQGTISADQRARAVAERLGLEFLDLSQTATDLAAVNLLPADVARRLELVPIGRVDDRTLLVAMADPTNVMAIDDVEIQTAMSVKAVVATRDDILALIAQTTRTDQDVSQIVEEEDDEPVELTNLSEAASETPVVKLINSLLAQAVGQGASDVHFEPELGDMRVRFRVDGVLEEVAKVPRRMVPPLVSRIKIMCDLDISERRMPQDGRLALTVDGASVDVRVVTLPTVHGESVVMRLLDRSNAVIDLARLGMSDADRGLLEAAIRSSHGSVLVTGPTGSGKSTTLYAALNTLNQPDRNIVTIEDPVEYQLPGITQVSVNSRAGLTFAAGLRSMMRADPDIIMVGEIRDRETAQISIEAALTGHLLLSTLHTNSAPGAITRLIEMGIEPFLVASSIRTVIAQRLARLLCTTCRKPVTLTATSLRQASFETDADIEAFSAGGCARCGGSGYLRRTGLYEIMNVSPAIRDLTLASSSSDQIAAAAREEGMRSLRRDALEKVRSGQTSIEEAVRVLGT